jgi:hypothetical protein
LNNKTTNPIFSKLSFIISFFLLLLFSTALTSSMTWNTTKFAVAQVNRPNPSNEQPLLKVVVLPDTQLLTVKGQKALYAQTRFAVHWGADYVVHVGDIVENWNYSIRSKDNQWKRADIAFKILDHAGIPYGILAGNHDMDDANTTGKGTTYVDGYKEYFPVSRVQHNGVWRENYGGPNENHYDILEKNGLKLLFVYASWNIRPDELDWVEGVIKNHPDHYIVMVTHGNIDAHGESVAPTDYSGIIAKTKKKSAQENLEFLSSLQRWRSMMGKYHNVVLQLSGHYDGANAFDTGHGLMAMLDYQGIGYGPPSYNWTKFDPTSTHYIGLLTFYKDGIRFITYNPSTDDYIWSDDHKYNWAGVDYSDLYSGEQWNYNINFNISSDMVNQNATKTNAIIKRNLPDFNFAAVGDWGCTPDTRNTINNMVSKSPELIVGLGDYAYNDTSADCWLKMIKPIHDKMKITIGNHDNVTSSPLILKQLMNSFGMSKEYYSFNYENVHFTVMSTELPFGIGSDQYNFVNKDLADAASDPNIDWLVVIYHKPVYISPNEHLSYPDNKTASVQPMITLRNVYHPLFLEYGVDLVLQGHQHAYERSYPIAFKSTTNSTYVTDGNSTYYRNPEGQIFVIVGTGGQGNYAFTGKDGKVVTQYVGFGFLNLNVANYNDNAGTTLSGTFYANDGSVKDQFAVSKGVNRLQKGVFQLSEK